MIWCLESISKWLRAGWVRSLVMNTWGIFLSMFLCVQFFHNKIVLYANLIILDPSLFHMLPQLEFSHKVIIIKRKKMKFISFKENVLFEMSPFYAAWSTCKTMHCSQLQWFSVDYLLWISVLHPALNPDTWLSCQKLMLISHLFSFPVAFRAPQREGTLSVISKACGFPRQIVYLIKKIEERCTLFVWNYINIL